MKRDDKPTVLLVDDDRDYLEQLEIQFERAGYRVLSAGCEVDARQLLTELKPDLAVLDLMMENLDGGFTLAHHIKREWPELPVIIVTGVTAETGMVFERHPGAANWIKADAVLAKPVRFEQILRELSRLGVRHG